MKKIAAVGYVRCSTEDQKDSPEQQKAAISKFADQNGYEVLEWFEDFGFSGTTFEQRPAFQRLLKAVKSEPAFSAVLCYDESRWGRSIDPEDNTFWRVYFRRNGVEVVLVKTSIDPHHEFAPMMKAFEGVQASQYSKKLSEVTLRGAMSNGRFSSGGFAPYGYMRAAIDLKTGEQRTLEDGGRAIPSQEKVVWIPGLSEEVSIVQRIFTERATGASYSHIVKGLNADSVPCPSRGRHRNKDSQWSTVTVKAIIDNPAYYGARVYNRNSMSKIRAQREGWDKRRHVKYPHWKQKKEDWVIEENAHELLVTKELWLKANSFRREDNGIRNKISAPYLLSSLIVCKKCGFRFQGQTTGAKGRHYHRYICGGYNSKRVCEFIILKRDLIEPFVLESIRETLTDDRFLERVNQLLMGNNAAAENERSSTEMRLNTSLSEVDGRLANIVRAIEQGQEPGLFKSRIDELQAEKALVQQRLEEELRRGSEREDLQDLIFTIGQFRDRFFDLYEQAPLHERKRLVQMWVDRVEVHHEPRVARVYVRPIPTLDGELDKRTKEGSKNRQAAQKSGSPVVSDVVAGAGLEPATFGL